MWHPLELANLSQTCSHVNVACLHTRNNQNTQKKRHKQAKNKYSHVSPFILLDGPVVLWPLLAVIACGIRHFLMARASSRLTIQCVLGQLAAGQFSPTLGLLSSGPQPFPPRPPLFLNTAFHSQSYEGDETTTQTDDTTRLFSDDTALPHSRIPPGSFDPKDCRDSGRWLILMETGHMSFETGCRLSAQSHSP